VNSPLSQGHLIDIAGVTTPGDYSPAIARAEVTVVGKAPLPTPARLSYDQYADGQHECQRLEVDGMVESGQVKQGRLQLNTLIDSEHRSHWFAGSTHKGDQSARNCDRDPAGRGHIYLGRYSDDRGPESNPLWSDLRCISGCCWISGSIRGAPGA